ncbi:MAG: CpsD/CapB family tyrosine-protein kinase [Halothiobacillaceae bacterium]|nr:MAG: CpsD/CapB family tyrosine-protein kinase [Halothiobacillaceae bacterium]
MAPETTGAPRIVFFSIKGGVGRSTALAATAWSLAQAGKRVLVLDLDLESPGLSSALLPPERQPMYGITDWLVEDLVDNGDAVFDSMVATSNLSHDGEIHVIPAHGADHGEYIAKLGRVWMPKVQADGTREIWSARLGRLLQALEARIQPDVVLIDSRSGIDEIASACITEMGANLILLFALEGEQTWNGYRMLFEQWQRAHVAETIRERLKIVGAVVPELDRVSYLEGLREHAYGVFVDTLYDEIAPPRPEAVGLASDKDGKWRVGDLVEGWNFDEADDGAPHYPWAVNWHRSFAGLRSLQGRLAVIDVQEVNAIFGSLLVGVRDAASVEGRS